MGSGGLVVMDEDNCMVDVAKFFLEFTQKESCGKCSPCREGTKHMLLLLNKISEGNGTMEDLETLENLANMVQEMSLCGLGQTASTLCLQPFATQDEYVAHIRDKKCPAERARPCSSTASPGRLQEVRHLRPQLPGPLHPRRQNFRIRNRDRTVHPLRHMLKSAPSALSKKVIPEEEDYE
ncbi:hypothetical protein MASR1M66_10710 [Aminivibrio sp.]